MYVIHYYTHTDLEPNHISCLPMKACPRSTMFDRWICHRSMLGSHLIGRPFGCVVWGHALSILAVTLCYMISLLWKIHMFNR